MKKKKNAAQYLEIRSGAYVLLSLLTLLIVGYSTFAVLVNTVIAMGTPEARYDLVGASLILGVAMVLLLYLSWKTGTRLWGEWQSRRASEQLIQTHEAGFSRLEDESVEFENESGDFNQKEKASQKKQI